MITTHRAFSCLALTLILAVFAADSATFAQSVAAPPSYNVELIVFRNSGGGGGGEDFSSPGARASLTGRSNDDGAANAAQVGRLLGILPAAQLQLTAEASRLRSAGYAVLAHLGWTQTASSWGSRAGFTLARLGAAVADPSGLVYLERGSYLHLGMNLRYGSYQINEMRRVKFYEKNYYDNPGFGVIALITPTQGARPPGR